MNFFRKYGMQVEDIAYGLLEGSSMKCSPDWSAVDVITGFRRVIDDTFEKLARSRVRLIGLDSETRF